MLSGIFDSIRKNHFAMMAVCCAIPVVMILGLRALGFDGWWIYPLALLVCVGSHAAMMLFGGEKKCH